MTSWDSDLLSSQAVSCVMMDETTKDDEYGGYTITLTNGATFQAIIIQNQSDTVMVAEQQTSKSLYGVKTPPTVYLPFHKIFRREDTGETYRVITKAGMAAPDSSALTYRQVMAEDWEVADG